MTSWTAPTIETERLVLRAHRADDFVEVFAMWSDDDVARFIGGSPSTAQESWFRMLRYAGLWSMVGFGYWAITDRATGQFLGDGGFADFHRAMPELEGVPEVGWALAPHAWGRGIATEAVHAMVAWSDATLDVPEVRCIIGSANVASTRVADKCGFRSLGDAALGDELIGVFGRRRVLIAGSVPVEQGATILGSIALLADDDEAYFSTGEQWDADA
jgi:RimJ/RimL family protein N-acetyltransferase